MTQSRDWYRAFFNHEPIEDSEKFAAFKICDVYLDIVEADGKSPLSPGGTVGYWLVDNLEHAIRHAESLGGSVYRGPLRVEETQRTIVQIKDPYGNVIGLECPF